MRHENICFLNSFFQISIILFETSHLRFPEWISNPWYVILTYYTQWVKISKKNFFGDFWLVDSALWQPIKSGSLQLLKKFCFVVYDLKIFKNIIYYLWLLFLLFLGHCVLKYHGDYHKQPNEWPKFLWQCSLLWSCSDQPWKKEKRFILEFA